MLKAGVDRQPFLIFMKSKYLFKSLSTGLDLVADCTVCYTESVSKSFPLFNLVVLLQETAVTIRTEQCFNLSKDFLPRQTLPAFPIGFIIFAFYC